MPLNLSEIEARQKEALKEQLSGISQDNEKSIKKTNDIIRKSRDSFMKGALKPIMEQFSQDAGANEQGVSAVTGTLEDELGKRTSQRRLADFDRQTGYKQDYLNNEIGTANTRKDLATSFSRKNALVTDEQNLQNSEFGKSADTSRQIVEMGANAPSYNYSDDAQNIALYNMLGIGIAAPLTAYGLNKLKTPTTTKNTTTPLQNNLKQYPTTTPRPVVDREVA